MTALTRAAPALWTAIAAPFVALLLLAMLAAAMCDRVLSGREVDRD